MVDFAAKLRDLRAERDPFRGFLDAPATDAPQVHRVHVAVDDAPAPAPPAPATFTPTPEQQAVLDKIVDWFRGGSGYRKRQELTLGGYAGTGKTSILKYLLTAGLGRIRAIAPTGKAARVLRKKGVPADTIHSFVYDFLGRDERGNLMFAPKENVGKPDLLLCDESSMVPLPIYRDLLDTGLRILWVGDHGQLEPVGDDALLMRDPELRLETIHRQAAESPILALAHAMRCGRLPVACELPELRVAPLRGMHRGLADPAWLESFDQILVAFNRTRVYLNAQIRAARGYRDVVHVSEKLMCRKNDRRRGLFNGMLVTVEAVRAGNISATAGMVTLAGNVVGDTAGGFVTVDVRTDDDRIVRDLDLWVPQFNRKDVADGPPGVSYFDYGYCATVHKAQGSEWSRVLVIEEPCSKWSMARWRYTASTRAAEHLTYLADDLVTGSFNAGAAQGDMFGPEGW